MVHAKALPVLVNRPRFVELPLDGSLGTNPSLAMS
jgi:hypothetical protein